MAGVTTTGFDLKTLDQIKSEIEDDLHGALGPDIDITATSTFGQIIGPFAKQLSEGWEVAAGVYNSFDPDANSGQAQDRVAAITAAERLLATTSKVTLTLNLDASKTVIAGSAASVPATGAKFVTLVDVTSTTAGNYDVAAEGAVTGPLVGNAGTITRIETPVTGWNSVTNALDAEVGRNVEADPDFRVRREQELRAQGKATADAIRGDVLEVPSTSGVQALIFNNTTDAVDGNGLPPHSYEIVASGGTDDDIAQAIWDSGAAGIGAQGSSSGTAIDANGDEHTVAFSRPTSVPIYFALTVLVNDLFPAGGDALIKAAIEAEEPNLKLGDSVYASAFYSVIKGAPGTTGGIPGIVDVPVLHVGTSASPSTTVATLTGRQQADLDTTRITVAHA